MADLTVSCAFATAADSPEHIRIAESLGYERAWLYDTPQQSPDVWVTLALAAQKTSRIGLGPGVLVPSLRHPMVNATATRTLQLLAPGRLAVAFGTGFTGRVAMGSPPLPWRYVADYVTAYRGLLRGETVEWEGARMRMMTPDVATARPPDLPPILLGATGPLGNRYATELDVDGIMVFGYPPETVRDHSWAAMLTAGTVLGPGEDHTSPRVLAAAGPGWAINYHFPYAVGGAEVVRQLPGGREFLAVVDRSEPRDRHFAVHEGHLVTLNAADRAAWHAGGHALLSNVPTVGTADEIARTAAELADLGVTELIYQPAGPDIPTELERFRDAVAGAAEHR